MTTENTQLVILDIQGKLSQIVYQSEEVLRNSTILIEGCKHLELPIVRSDSPRDCRAIKL